jgi:hypothetical protein
MASTKVAVVECGSNTIMGRGRRVAITGPTFGMKFKRNVTTPNNTCVREARSWREGVTVTELKGNGNSVRESRLWSWGVTMMEL